MKISSLCLITVIESKVIAKSSVVLDVKPWSDETDLKDMETNVRKIESVGLKWGACKFFFLLNNTGL